MIVTLQTERVRTLDQVRAFVEGSEAVDFAGADRESVYEFVRRALVRLDYERFGKSDNQTQCIFDLGKLHRQLPESLDILSRVHGRDWTAIKRTEKPDCKGERR